MTEITLHEPTLVKEIETIAAHEGIEPAKFVTDSVRRQIALYRQKRIAAESDAWYRMPAEERNKYKAKYVAVFDGEIVGTGDEPVKLLMEMRERFAKQPVLIVEGGDAPMPTYNVVSVRGVYSDAE